MSQRSRLESLPAWAQRGLVSAPGLSESDRAELAGQTALRLLESGKPEQADEVATKALARIESPRLRAELLATVAEWSLEHGQRPALVMEAYAAQLDVADRQYAKKQYAKAAEPFARAMRMATHRVLHFDSLTSPLSEDPSGFTAPLRESKVAAAMRAPRGRGGVSAGVSTGPTIERGSTSGEAARVLVATRVNADFLQEIRAYVDESPDFDARFMDFAEVHELDRFAKSPERIVLQTIAKKPGLPNVAEEAFRAHLEWADVVFIEWCTALAALLTQIDPGDTRIVVRMHSYEAFTVWPHLMDFSRVDDMVFVSEHLRDIAVAAIPGLQGPNAPRLHVIANAMELQRFERPKNDDARFTLGVVGASKMVKDPRWAIEVLRHLRKYDERYRLQLIRGKLQDPTPAAQAYARDLQRDLAELEPSGAVQVLAHTDDVPTALQDVGVVISSSVRESFHMGLVEGVASGAVPVVRDWPFFPDGARQLFPEEWVADTPEQAAQRILALTASDEVWRRAGREAAEYVIGRWDWSVVQQEFDRLLRG